jgi:hypothetical protein
MNWLKMSKIFHQFITGGRKQLFFCIRKIFEHAQKPKVVFDKLFGAKRKEKFVSWDEFKEHDKTKRRFVR